MPHDCFDLLKAILKTVPDLPINTFKNRFVYLNPEGFKKAFSETLPLFEKASAENLNTSSSKKLLEAAKQSLQNKMNFAEDNEILAPTILSIMQKK